MVPEMESMFERAKRGDCEGLFRWHWVLIDSLEIFFDIMHHPYFGPKKTLKWMEEKHPEPLTVTERLFKTLIWSVWRNGLCTFYYAISFCIFY